MEKSFENKEKLDKIVIEIGANSENSYIKQYKKDLPLNTKYSTIHINYGILTTESKKLIPREDESVDEIILSNVLADIADTRFISPSEENKFAEEILRYHEGTLKDGKEKWNYIQSEIAYRQKLLTITDAIRILKPNGFLIIYENYRQFHPDAVRKILKWLKNNPELEFIEDVDEEARIQPIFDKEKEEIIDRSKKLNRNSQESELYFPRKFNNVYKIRKK